MDNKANIQRRCWAAEGIWGTSDCNRLQTVAHCFNCEVFEEAGSKFLEINKKATEPKLLVSSAPLENSASTLQLQKLESIFVFDLGSHHFALPMSAIAEVSNKRQVHRIPHRRDSVINGLVNVNGELLLCVDLLNILTDISIGETAERMVVCTTVDGKFAFNAHSIGMIKLDVKTFREIDLNSSQNYNNFAEKSFDYLGKTYTFIDFELLAHAITKRRI